MKNRILGSELFFSRTHDFLDVFLPSQAGKSDKTVKAYRDVLSIFRRFVCDVKKKSITTFRFSDSTYEFVLEFSRYLRETKHYAPSSVNQRLAAIKSYVRYAADCDIALQQICFSIMNVPFLSVPKLHRPIIEKETLAAFLSAPGNSKFGVRDRLMLILLFDSAIRIDELLHLCLSSLNINADTPYIRVHGKRNKERIVAIRDRTVEHLKAYIRVYHPNAENLSRPLFYTVINGNMNIMSERNAERIIKKYADIVRKEHPDLPETVYPHMLRRTRATGLYRDGVAIELISRILGHSSTQTTRIYAIPSAEMLRDAMERGLPNETDKKPLWEGHEDELIRLCGLR